MSIIIERIHWYETYYVPVINKLLPQLSSHAKPITDEEFTEVSSDWRRDFLFGAKDDAKAKPDDLVGVAYIFFQPRVEGWHAEIHSVVVDEPYHGQGISKRLVEAMIEAAKMFAKMHGLKHVDLTCQPNREVANKLYKSFGFKPRAEPRHLSDGNVDPKGTNYYRLEVTP